LALVSPVTVIGEAVPVSVPAAPPSSEVQLAEKLVIALPLSAPGVNATKTDVLPRVTLEMVGASGAAAGMTLADADEGALVPIALVAVTVHVYVLPLVRLLTVIGDDSPVLLPAVPPLLDVHDAEYERIANPLSAPGVKATEIDALLRVTLVIVGGSGTAAGMTGSDGREAVLVPTALVAVTVQV
jgi:hypothetical protein